MRRNCHHLRTIRYHDTSEKTARMASTNCVSRLDVSTSSHGVVGIAPRTCTSTLTSSVTVGVMLMPAPGTPQNLLQTGMRSPASYHRPRAVHRRDELPRIARTPATLDR